MIFRIKLDSKHRPPPIDYVGLWDSSCFSFIGTIDNDTKIPFYTKKKFSTTKYEYTEELIYSFEELLMIKINSPIIASYKQEMSLLKHKTSKNSQKIISFC
jgi:hypothetical protein